MTGKSKASIKEYQKRGQFPEPVKILASGPLWLRGLGCISIAYRNDFT